jgi:hypothetical protein
MKRFLLAILLALGLGMAVAPASFAGGGPPSTLPNGG